MGWATETGGDARQRVGGRSCCKEVSPGAWCVVGILKCAHACTRLGRIMKYYSPKMGVCTGVSSIGSGTR